MHNLLKCVAMKWLISLPDKYQQHHHWVHSRLSVYLSVWQREATKNWTKLQHFNKWIHLPGCKHGKLFIGSPCKKRADDLLKMNRYQLKLVAAILTGYAPVRGHLRTIGLFDGDPSCRFCGMETETVQKLVCRCEALSRQRYNVFGELIIEPKDIWTATVRETCVSSSQTQGYLNCAEWSV